MQRLNRICPLAKPETKPEAKPKAKANWLYLGLPIATTAIGMNLLTMPLQAQTATIFENITLDPSFAPDPRTVRGISGGSQNASDVTGRTDTATGPCTGFIDDQPDHRIELTEYFNYLSLTVEAIDDTTLIVRGPGGTWCNDDHAGKNPGIAGEWLSGTYEIWIGSYEENQYSPYVIRISEVRSP